MKIFHCDHCQQLVFYENVRCVSCQHDLAYLPDLADMAALEPTGGGAVAFAGPRGRGVEVSSVPELHGGERLPQKRQIPEILCQDFRDLSLQGG